MDSSADGLLITFHVLKRWTARHPHQSARGA